MTKYEECIKLIRETEGLKERQIVKSCVYKDKYVFLLSASNVYTPGEIDSPCILIDPNTMTINGYEVWILILIGEIDDDELQRSWERSTRYVDVDPEKLKEL